MKRPSPALVISILALFVALGGTSYAVTKLSKNSVGTPQLKKNAVTGAKVKDGSLSGSDIDVATLGTVPAASSSNRANSAQTAERAGSAGTADSATNAANATNAVNATNAQNAQTLGGKTAAELIQESKVRCPEGMKLAAGVCIDETPSTAAALYTAFQTCGEADRRLPTTGELIAYVNQYDTSVTEEWVEPEVIEGSGFKGVYVTASSVEYSATASERSVPLAYRCVTAASNLN